MLTRITSRAAPRWAPAATRSHASLSTDQVEQFHRDGFLVLPDHLPKSTVTELRGRMDVLLDAYKPDTISVFSTDEQARESDEYFLSSGDKIRFFFEEGAVAKDGSLVKPAKTAINKVGHALHDLDPVFRRHTYTPENAALCAAMGLERPLVVQSMYIFKQPGIGGRVDAHQDGVFIYTRPQSALGLWWALERCTTTNGCLWAIPGSHKDGVKRRFKRSPDGKGTMFEPPEEEDWDFEVDPGALVLIHNSVIHFSEANTSEQSRHAYALHIVEGANGVEWPKDNWLQTDSVFRSFDDYDAGTNSFKGAAAL